MSHPITPPLDLVAAWCREADDNEPMFPQVAAKAAQWGAEQEIEAICERLEYLGWHSAVQDIRATRRPKSPSLKRVALLQLDTLNADLGLEGKGVDLSQIRRALEQLND